MFAGYDPFAISAALSAVAILLSIWELAWKGVGLWRAARNSHKWWFVAILILNTVGILPMLYYFFFSGRKPQHDPQFAFGEWAQSCMARFGF